MHVHEPAKAPPTESEERKLTKHEQQLSDEVNRYHAALANKFFAFMCDTDDPEGPEVNVKRITLCAQWKMFCKRKGLLAIAYPLLDQYCEGLIKEYTDAKLPEAAPVIAPDLEQWITFEELIEYGRNNGANTVNGMPWSFNYNGVPVTHENDECYLIACQRFTPKDVMMVRKDSQVMIKQIILEDSDI